MFESISITFEGKALSILAQKVSPSDNRLPCLVFGLSSHYFDKIFVKQFRLILIDLYWTNTNFDSTYIKQLTLLSMVKHIEQVRAQLQTKYGHDYHKIVAFGHSTYGYLAMEYAKTYPDHVHGVINVGTPPHFNGKILKTYQEQYLNANFGYEASDGNNERWRDYYDYQNRQQSSNDIVSWYVSMGPILWKNKKFWQNKNACVTKLWHPYTIPVVKDNNQTEKVTIVINTDMLSHYLLSIATQCDYQNQLITMNFPILWFIGLYDCRVSLTLFDNIKLAKKTQLYYTLGGHWTMFEDKQQIQDFNEQTEKWCHQFQESTL